MGLLVQMKIQSDDSSLTFAESSLDPRKGSKSMGISFVVSSQIK